MSRPKRLGVEFGAVDAGASEVIMLSGG